MKQMINMILSMCLLLLTGCTGVDETAPSPPKHSL